MLPWIIGATVFIICLIIALYLFEKIDAYLKESKVDMQKYNRDSSIALVCTIILAVLLGFAFGFVWAEVGVI